MKHFFNNRDLTNDQKKLRRIIYFFYIVLIVVKIIFIDSIILFKNYKTAYSIIEFICITILFIIGIKNKLFDKFALMFYTSIAIILTLIVFYRK
jgi:hypothetical protein